MSRIHVVATVVFFGVAVFCPDWALSQDDPTDVWADLLIENLQSLSNEDDSLEERQVESMMMMAGHALSLGGRAEKAISLLRERLPDSAVPFALLSIADAQSASDDVEGAYRTAALLPNERLVQRARSLIAMRQAQRGDLEESVQLLDKIEDTDQRNRARKIIIDELLEAHRYEDAVAQYALVNDKEAKETIRQQMKRVREKRVPSDPDYIEKTVAGVRRWKSRLGGFSDEDAKLVEFECRARVAAHRNDNDSFNQAIDNAMDLIQDWEVGDRCSALLSLGTICAESDYAKKANELFSDALNTLFNAENSDFADSHYAFYFGFAVNDHFEQIAQVMSDRELLDVSKRIVAVAPDVDLLGAFGRGLGAAGKTDIADAIYKDLQRPVLRIQFSTGTLHGLALRATRLEKTVSSDPSSDESRDRSLVMIDRIIADKPPLEFNLAGKQRPERDFLGAYNVSRTCLPNYEGKIWHEVEELPELTLEEFLQVRSDVMSALWGHGSVYGFPGAEGKCDFFVYEDKFFDRTQKIEIQASDYLSEILPSAVADVQKTLAKHPLWRVMVLGHGEDAKDEFFVIYPDAIQILQAENGQSMADGIKANATLRSADR
ncbi:hypothetical protein SH528x_007172 [Novipirellula sp. SH528]|uniref:hypothetical protein n=1 Tax=Novipirellula sp. SH528 TaxID=3454466 RepID=UPI003FA15CB0